MVKLNKWVKSALNERINLIRTELFFAAAFTFLLALLLNYSSETQFNILVAYIISGSLIVLLIISFLPYLKKFNLRLFSYTAYAAGLLFTVYIAHNNNYNFDSFFVLIFVYGFYAITLANLRIYLYLNLLIGSAILGSILILQLETEVHWLIILSTFIFLNLLGQSTSLTRAYLKRKLKDREFIMNHIFNNSKIGMLLVNQSDNRIFEANKTAANSLGFEHRYNLNGLVLNDIKIDDKAIFNFPENMEKKSIELKDKRIFTIYKKEANYNNKNYSLIEFSEYKNVEDLNYSAEFEKLKLISEESYESLFKQSASLVCIIDKKGRIIDVSDTFTDLLGYSREEIIGKKANGLDLENYEEKRKKIDENAWNGEIKQFEKGIVTKSGKVGYIEVILKKGKYFGEDVLISNSRNITKRKELEEEVLKKTKEYENLLKNSPISIIVCDEDGNIREFNPAFSIFFGIKKQRNIKFNLKDTIVDKDYKKYSKQLELLKKGKIFAVEMAIEYKNNENELKQALLKTITHSSDVETQLFLTQIVDISDRHEYEKMLEESRRTYKHLIDNSIVGMAIIKQDIIVFVNNKALEILKISDESKLLGKSRFDFVSKEEAQILAERVKKLQNGENVPLREFNLNNQEGETVRVEIKPSLIEYENEQATLISFIDIDDKTKAEIAEKKVFETKSMNESLRIQLEQNRKIQKRLQNAQSYSAGVVESSLDMIFTTDVNGNLTSLNSAAKNKLQLKEADFAGKNYSILFNDHKIAEELLSRLTDEESFSGEVRLKKKKGNSFPAYLSISYLYNTDGAFLGMMGISRDISELKQKESEIRAQASKLTSIIESSSHYFFTVNRKFEISSFNKLFEEDVFKSFGVKIERNDSFKKLFTTRKNHQESWTEEDLRKFWENKFESVFKGSSISFEIERISLDGQPFFREIFLNPIYSESGTINEVSGISHDTTDKRLYERELKKSLEEKEILLKEVHHRVKNNMQVISSILNLQSAYIDDDKILSIFKESQNRIRAMASIHERLYRTKNFSDIKFSEYIKDLAENLVHTYEFSDTKISLQFNIEEVFLTLNVSIPCGLIINELISNALKYAFEGKAEGRIDLSISKKGKKVCLIVEDDGVGIPESFNIEQADSLGLQLVSTLVEQIEGEMHLDRSKGSKFTISFEPNQKER